MRVLNRYVILILCGFCLPIRANIVTQESTQNYFKKLLNESGLTFLPSENFVNIQPKANAVLQYEYALKHQSDSLEIRFIIRPLGRLRVDYNDPHNASPEPNHLFPLLFQSLINELSKGGNTLDSAYPKPQADEFFNADWAAATVFDVNPKFSDTYKQALMIAIHKDNKADAYSIFLFNKYSDVKESIKKAISTLTFIPAD